MFIVDREIDNIKYQSIFRPLFDFAGRRLFPAELSIYQTALSK